MLTMTILPERMTIRVQYLEHNRSCCYRLLRHCNLAHHKLDNFGKWSNFAGPYSFRRRCIDGRHVHDYCFDYFKQLQENYRKSFSMVLFSEAHEGSGEVIATVDESQSSYLQWMKKNGKIAVP